MTLIKKNLFDTEEFFNDFERLFAPLFAKNGTGIVNNKYSLHKGMSPATDVVEYKDEYILQVEIPGVDPDKLIITTENNVLQISAEKVNTVTKENASYSRTERLFGKYYRAFTLENSMNLKEVEATYTNGVLKIRIPKKLETEDTKPRKIELKNLG